MNALRVLLWQRAGRDRWSSPIWIASTAFLALASAIGIDGTYGSEQERSGILAIASKTPALLILRGLPDGASLGQFTFFQIFTYLALMAGFMSTFLAVRHSRAEEESSRAELIASTPASRTLPTLATIVHGVLTNVVLGLAVWIAFVAGGLDSAGSAVTGAATAAVGISFLGVGLVAAELMRTSRGANFLATGVLGATFILRGVGDALGTLSKDGLHLTSSWVSWLSPIGWAQHVGAFDENTLAPLSLNLALGLVAFGLVIALQSRRDLGASVFPERPGHAEAGPTLHSAFGLAWRLQWPSIAGWSLGGAAFGLLAGTLADLVRQVVATDPDLGDSLNTIARGGGTIDQSLISAMFMFVGLLAAGSAIQAVIRARQEESSGTAELVLSTSTSRVRWFVDYLLLGVLAILAVLVSGAAVSSVGALATGDQPSHIADAFAAAAAQLPAALVFLGVLAVTFTAVPGATALLGWLSLGAATFAGIFGPLIGVPEWVQNLSPFAHSPVPFGSDADWTGGLWMLVVALVAGGLAVLLMRRRGLAT